MKNKVTIVVYGVFLLATLVLYVNINIELRKRGVWMQAVNKRLDNLENGK